MIKYLCIIYLKNIFILNIKYLNFLIYKKINFLWGLGIGDWG